MNQTLDLKRLWFTIAREFSLNKINLLIIAASMILVCLVVTYTKGALTPRSFGSTAEYLRVYHSYPIVVLIYCVVVSAFIFHDLNTTDKEIDYLMLPSSTLEKYLTKYLLTTVGFILLAVFAIAINKLQVNFLNKGTNLSSIYTLKPFSELQYLLLYLIAHSIFFFGSVYFRKMELAKVILTLIMLMVMMYFFIQFLSAIGLVDLLKLNQYLHIGYSGFNDDQNQIPTVQSINKLRTVYESLGSIAKWVFALAVPPFFWILGFIRLKEIEVKDGV